MIEIVSKSQCTDVRNLGVRASVQMKEIVSKCQCTDERNCDANFLTIYQKYNKLCIKNIPNFKYAASGVFSYDTK